MSTVRAALLDYPYVAEIWNSQAIDGVISVDRRGDMADYALTQKFIEYRR